jgi:hypothetical protein
MNNKYKIIDDFQAGHTDIRILVLDRDFDSFCSAPQWRAVIDDEEYEFNLNSIGCWITIKSHDSFTGKEVEFV